MTHQHENGNGKTGSVWRVLGPLMVSLNIACVGLIWWGITNKFNDLDKRVTDLQNQIKAYETTFYNAKDKAWEDHKAYDKNIGVLQEKVSRMESQILKRP